MELTCLDFDKKTSSESLTSSFGDLENAAFKTKAVERENGEMKVEIRLNPKTSIDKLCIKIPQSEEKKQKVIIQMAKFLCFPFNCFELINTHQPSNI